MIYGPISQRKQSSIVIDNFLWIWEPTENLFLTDRKTTFLNKQFILIRKFADYIESTFCNSKMLPSA